MTIRLSDSSLGRGDHRRGRADHAGFTLAELLVVMGIIAVLVAILLPSIAKARRQANEVWCASNLRQWGQAFYAYAAQSHGLIPHSGDRSRNPFGYVDLYCPAFPERESCYTDALPPLMGQPRWSDFANGQKPTGGIWQCPIAEVLSDSTYGYSPSSHGYHTYAMNMYLNYDYDPTGVMTDLYPSFLQMANAKDPSATLLMFETTLSPAAGYDQRPQSIACLGGYYPDENARSFSERHPHQSKKLGGNLLMLDGHVEWRDHLWDGSISTPERPPTSDRLWWPY